MSPQNQQRKIFPAWGEYAVSGLVGIVSGAIQGALLANNKTEADIFLLEGLGTMAATALGAYNISSGRRIEAEHLAKRAKDSRDFTLYQEAAEIRKAYAHIDVESRTVWRPEPILAAACAAMGYVLGSFAGVVLGR